MAPRWWKGPGTATDAEDGILSGSLGWTSSEDGALGSGASVNATLSLGTHTITAAVTDGGGLSGNDQITVSVTAAPVDVPDVTGQTQASAEADLLAAGLTVGSGRHGHRSEPDRLQRLCGQRRSGGSGGLQRSACQHGTDPEHYRTCKQHRGERRYRGDLERHGDRRGARGSERIRCLVVEP
jgi:hypothetical protein